MSLKINWANVWFILQLVILLFVAALGNWFTKDFDTSYIFSQEWWGDTLLQITYNYSMLYIWFGRRIDKLLELDPIYLRYENTLNSEIKVLDPNTFNPWFDGFNLKQKIKHFIDYISKKLQRLENKVKPEDIHLWENGTVEEKSKNTYCIKRFRLEEQLKPEYIENNIRLINVGYKNIKKAFITNGYNNRRNVDNSIYSVENGGLKFFKDLLPRTILTTGIILIFRTIILDFIETQNLALLVFQTVMTLLPMLLHANVGWKYGSQYFKEKILVDARTREEIISLFYTETRKEIG